MNFTSSVRQLREANSLAWILPVTGSLAVGMAWTVLGPLWVLATLLGAILMGTALSSYTWTLGIVLVGRTALDLFWEKNVILEGIRISPASIFILIILGVLLVTLMGSRTSLHHSDGV